MVGSTKYITDFVNVDRFRSWDRPTQWKYVDRKRQLATQLYPDRTYTTGELQADKILYRKLQRHIKFYVAEIHRQDELVDRERWALIRAAKDPCQTTLESFLGRAFVDSFDKRNG